MAEEGLKRTPNRLIHIGKPIPFEYSQFLEDIKQLMDVSYEEDENEIYRLVQRVVTTFRPSKVAVTM